MSATQLSAQKTLVNVIQALYTEQEKVLKDTHQ